MLFQPCSFLPQGKTCFNYSKDNYFISEKNLNIAKQKAKQNKLMIKLSTLDRKLAVN